MKKYEVCVMKNYKNKVINTFFNKRNAIKEMNSKKGKYGNDIYIFETETEKIKEN